MNEYKIQKTHCDWIITQMQEIKALLSYESDRMIVLNKTRAVSAINTSTDSLRELELYIKSITE